MVKKGFGAPETGVLGPYVTPTQENTSIIKLVPAHKGKGKRR